MSDFDDEPTEGAEANDAAPSAAAAEAPASTGAATPATKASAPDDDWDDDWDDDSSNGGGGRRDLTLVYAIVAAAIVIVIAVVLTRPKDNTPAANQGAANGPTTSVTAPSKNWQGPVGDAVGDKGSAAQQRAQATGGVTIWTDFWGWHIRSNGPDEVKVTVSADQVRVKKSDDYNDKDENGSAPFSAQTVVTLPPGDGKSGVGLDLGNSENATFTVNANGAPIAFTKIKLGGSSGQADSNPITFIKA